MGALLGVLSNLAWWHMSTRAHGKSWKKKNQHSVPQRAEFAAAHGRQAKLVLWIVLEKHGFSWFPQNKDALQPPEELLGKVNANL